MNVAVVGGGLAGLTAARMLARRGHRTHLWEAQPHLGGVARPVHWRGHTFCPGPQYIWGFAEGGPGHQLLVEAGLTVPMHDLGHSFESMAVGDEAFRIMEPGDSSFEHGLDQLGRSGRIIAQRAGFRGTGASMLRAVASSNLAKRDQLELLRARHESVASYARRYGTDETTLRRVLYSQGIFAESLEDLSAVVFAAARQHLLEPMHVPHGGIAHLVQSLIDTVARDEAVEVHLDTPVLRADVQAHGTQLFGTEGPLGTFDRVVAACSPAITSRLLGRALPYTPSNTMTAAMVEVVLTPEARHGLQWRNFTWFADNHDIDFVHPTHAPKTLNFTSPTLNGGSMAQRQVVCAFAPARRQAEPLLQPLVCTLERLLTRIDPGIRITASEAIGPTTWTHRFGAHEAAIYGRRLTADSLQQSVVPHLPSHWAVAHSGAGIPGVLACMQMGAAAASEVCP